MEQKQKTLKPETALFVEALQAILQAEDKTLSAFSLIYGEETSAEGAQTPGGEMYNKSDLSALFGKIKGKVKEWIGNSVELDLLGLLSGAEKKEEV